MKATYSSEASVDVQPTTWRYGTPHNHRCENLKSYIIFIGMVCSGVGWGTVGVEWVGLNPFVLQLLVVLICGRFDVFM
jgi:hypothetical protein